MKNAKNGQFWRVFENLKLKFKKCCKICQFLKDKNWWKMPKLKIQMRYFEWSKVHKNDKMVNFGKILKA